MVQVGRDTSRAISFEAVSANLRDRRDTGDADLFPGVRLFPLRYNGGGPIDQVNGRSVPAGWPLARYPVAGGQGVRLGFDVLATGLSPNDKKLKLHVIGVGGEHLTYPAKGFRAIVGR